MVVFPVAWCSLRHRKGARRVKCLKHEFPRAHPKSQAGGTLLSISDLRRPRQQLFSVMCSLPFTSSRMFLSHCGGVICIMNQILALPRDYAYVNLISDWFLQELDQGALFSNTGYNAIITLAVVAHCTELLWGGQQWAVRLLRTTRVSGMHFALPCALDWRGCSSEDNCRRKCSKIFSSSLHYGSFFLRHWHFMVPSFLFKHHNTPLASGVHSYTTAPKP